jgi:hypothetical protein
MVLFRFTTRISKTWDKFIPVGELYSYVFNNNNLLNNFQHILKYKQHILSSRHWQLPLRFNSFVITNAALVESYTIVLKLDKNANFHFLILKQNAMHVLTDNQNPLVTRLFTNHSLMSLRLA